MQTYSSKLAENKLRLLQLLSMRRQGNCQSAEYKALKTAAMRQYSILTNEACKMYRNDKLMMVSQ